MERRGSTVDYDCNQNGGDKISNETLNRSSSAFERKYNQAVANICAKLKLPTPVKENKAIAEAQVFQNYGDDRKMPARPTRLTPDSDSENSELREWEYEICRSNQAANRFYKKHGYWCSDSCGPGDMFDRETAARPGGSGFGSFDSEDNMLDDNGNVLVLTPRDNDGNIMPFPSPEHKKPRM